VKLVVGSLPRAFGRPVSKYLGLGSCKYEGVDRAGRLWQGDIRVEHPGIRAYYKPHMREIHHAAAKLVLGEGFPRAITDPICESCSDVRNPCVYIMSLQKWNSFSQVQDTMYFRLKFTVIIYVNG
jgi:hypothetical protein